MAQLHVYKVGCRQVWKPQYTIPVRRKKVRDKYDLSHIEFYMQMITVLRSIFSISNDLVMIKLASRCFWIGICSLCIYCFNIYTSNLVPHAEYS